MPAPFRAVLADGVAALLRQAIPAIPCAAARRAEVMEAERPLLTVTTGDASCDDGAFLGEHLWTVDVVVTGYTAATDNRQGGMTARGADAAAEAALHALEARILEALSAQTLDGRTMGLRPVASAVELYPAERASARMGDVTVTFRVQLLLPLASATL